MTLIKEILLGNERILWDGVSLEEARLEPIVKDIKARSITPTTFHKRVFETNIDNSWFKDLYQHNTSSVVRFGINKACQNVKLSIESEGVKIIDESTAQSVSSTKTTKYTLDDAKKVVLCHVESDLLQRAVGYLLSTPTANTVLVDILERYTNSQFLGAVKFNGDSPKTHSVVLCKNQLQKGVQEIIPEKKKKQFHEVKAVIAIIKKGPRYFIQQRPSKGLLADLWEFPGGKMEAGESPEAALKREVKEELGIDVKNSNRLMKVRHFYTQFKVDLDVFACELKKFPAADTTHKWVKFEELKNYPMPSGSAKIVSRLQKIS